MAHGPLVDTCHDARYWPKVSCCTILTPLIDIEVIVTDFEILLKFLK